MKIKILLGLALLGFVYIVWALLLKLLPIILVAIGCWFIYKAVKAINGSGVYYAFRNLFLAYFFVISGSIMNGTLIVHWDNFSKISPIIFK